MANNSEKLEREAGGTRAQLAEALDALRARMTPGQVIDQLIDYAREGPGAGFGRNLAREVHDESHLYAEGIRRGYAMLVVRSGAGDQEQIISLLDQRGNTVAL